MEAMCSLKARYKILIGCRFLQNRLADDSFNF